MNKKLLKQLALAKQAGTQSMAKDFFAKTPSPGTEPGAEGAMPGGDAVQTSADPLTAGPTNDDAGAGEPDGDEMNPEDMTPEQLEELLRMLESQGGGQG